MSGRLLDIWAAALTPPLLHDLFRVMDGRLGDLFWAEMLAQGACMLLLAMGIHLALYGTVR